MRKARGHERKAIATDDRSGSKEKGFFEKIKERFTHKEEVPEEEKHEDRGFFEKIKEKFKHDSEEGYKEEPEEESPEEEKSKPTEEEIKK